MGKFEGSFKWTQDVRERRERTNVATRQVRSLSHLSTLLLQVPQFIAACAEPGLVRKLATIQTPCDALAGRRRLSFCLASRPIPLLGAYNAIVNRLRFQ